MEETTTNTAHFLDLSFTLTDNAGIQLIDLSLDAGFVWLTSMNQGSQGNASCGAPQLCICGGIQMLPDSHLHSQKHYVKKY